MTEQGLTGLTKYYIVRTYGKVRKTKERLLLQLGQSFQGAIQIIRSKPASYRDYVTVGTYYYTLINTEWKKMSYDKFKIIVTNNQLSYEHLEIEKQEL